MTFMQTSVRAPTPTPAPPPTPASLTYIGANGDPQRLPIPITEEYGAEEGGCAEARGSHARADMKSTVR